MLKNMPHDIDIGDIVHLKSGGPEMAVIAVNATKAICQWGLDGCKSRTSSFIIEALTKEIK